jgi:polysaccharide pyruvyl transferase WcaK-like protein
MARGTDHLPDAKYWVILSGGNGSTNLGDECMWEAGVRAAREVLGPVSIVTDGHRGWKAPLNDVVVLPYLHTSLRRGAIIPEAWMSSSVVRFAERLISAPRRNEYAYSAARRARKRPRSAVQRLWLQTIERAEGVIISGSGAINDELAAHGISSWGLISEWAERNAKPVAMIGQGIGPINKVRNKRRVAEMLARMGHISVRETESRALAVRLGSKSQVTPDWALGIVPTLADRQAAARVREHLVGSDPFIALSVHRRRSTPKSDLVELSRILEQFVEVAIHRQIRVVFVPNMTAGPYSDDRATARRITSTWSRSTREYVAMQDRPMTHLSTRAFLGQAGGLISTRYHPMVFALVEGTPSVGISYNTYYDQKLEGISNLFGVENNVYRLGSGSLQPARICEILNGQHVVSVNADLLRAITDPLSSFLEPFRGDRG